MERVESLIKRLLELHETRADESAMLLTAQMLVQELQQNSKAEAVNKKVSVIHPAFKNIIVRNAVVETVAEKPTSIKEQPITQVQQPYVPVAPEKIVEKKEERHEPLRTFASQPKIEDIPTYAYQQKEVVELNESVSSSAGQSLNDRLKTESKELGSILKESPVKDLKKAIGINDRFVFIEELFRGDEIMYERSIKTINSFSIFPEAEYWIQRELKTKVGWDEESPTVKHFDQLVRRRFS